MADPNRGEIGFVEEPQSAEGKKEKVGEVKLWNYYLLIPELMRQTWVEMAEQLPKAEDGTIIPPTKEEMAALIAGSIGKTGTLDDSGLQKLQEVALQMLESFGNEDT